MPPRSKSAAPKLPPVSKNEDIVTNKQVTVLHADLLAALNVVVPEGDEVRLHVQNYDTLEIYVGTTNLLGWMPKDAVKYTFSEAALMDKFHIVPPAPTKPQAGGTAAPVVVTMKLNSSKQAVVFTIVSTEQHTY